MPNKMDAKQNILLIEDNLYDEELICRILRDLPNPVDVVRDGQQALDYLFASGRQETGTLPCLVLLDLKLPKVPGLEVLRAIRANERTAMMPVVIMTASAAEEEMLSSYRNGANSYMRKPLKRDDFMKMVKIIGLYWTHFTVQPRFT